MINRNFIFERVSEPEIEPVTLAEMKRHLRMFADVTDEDGDVAALIQGGRQWVESYTGRALVDQTWRLTLGGRLGGYVGGDIVGGYSPSVFPFGRYEWLHWMRRGEIYLRRSPVLEIVSFTTVDVAGEETDVDPSTYEVREKDSKWPRLVALNNGTWPMGDDLRIVFRAGYVNMDISPPDDVSKIPVTMRQAIKLWGEANYDRDQNLMKIYLDTAERLVQNEKASLGMV